MKVKICGLCRPEDAAHAVATGATHVGVVLAPGSRRGQSPDRAAEIYGAAGRAVRVGVFVDASPERLLELADALTLDVLQLHGHRDPGELVAIRASGPWDVWQVVRPRDWSEYATAVTRYAERVDGVLVDGYAADAAGGTGVRAPWSELAGARDVLPGGVLLGLAGGLTPETVAEAIDRVGPDLVDVSSGVEAELCRKDPARVARFVALALAGGRVE